MRAVVQRVRRAAVAIGGALAAEIGTGLLVLIGLARDDTRGDMEYIAEKCLNLRVFDDEDGVMNLSAVDVNAGLLLVSQFTLYGDARKGRRPSYIKAAPPDEARGMFDNCVDIFKEKYDKIEPGVFQAMMDVSLVNDGPVTILLDSKKEF